MKRRLIKTTGILSAMALFLVTSLSCLAQDFSQLKSTIDNTGSCRIACITNSGACFMVAGPNGSARYNCPTELNNAFQNINSAGHTIVDAQITEQGAWVVLYGANGYATSGVPQSLNNKFKELNAGGYTFLSVAINDLDEWVVVTTTNISFSDNDLRNAIMEDTGSYGGVGSVCLNDDAMVVVYQNGYSTYGEVPSRLSNALSSSGINAFNITLAGDKWVICDANGSYSYYM